MLPRRLAAAGTFAALALVGGSVRAAGPLGPEGSPITTSDYRIDLSRGVVLAGTRVLGLAGAYVAIAEGVDGNSANPVAPAMRSPHSHDHFDYDLGFGLTFPSAVSGTDLFNSGDRTSLSASQNDALFVDLAANLQFGRWGTGVSLHYTTFEVAEPGGQSLGLNARFGGLRVQVARSWLDGQFLLGLGSRGTGLVIANKDPEPGEPAELFHIEGAAAEVGALFRPNDAPYRIGVAVRSAVITNQLSSEVTPDADGIGSSRATAPTSTCRTRSPCLGTSMPGWPCSSGPARSIRAGSIRTRPCGGWTAISHGRRPSAVAA